jgi:peptide/nickel transport system substrate-binding protein
MRAIDWQTVIEGAYSGFGTPIGSPFAPSDQDFVDLTNVLPHDPDKAKQLIAEAGYSNGFTLTFRVPQMAETTRSAEILQAMLADVGVILNIVPSEFPTKGVDEVFLKKNYEMSVIDHAEPMDIDIYSRPSDYFNYHNPKFDAIIDEAERATDQATRDKLYGEAQKILAEEVPAHYLFDLSRLGIWSEKLEGLWPNEPLPEVVVVKDVFWAE